MDVDRGGTAWTRTRPAHRPSCAASRWPSVGVAVGARARPAGAQVLGRGTGDAAYLGGGLGQVEPVPPAGDADGGDRAVMVAEQRRGDLHPAGRPILLQV